MVYDVEHSVAGMPFDATFLTNHVSPSSDIHVHALPFCSGESPQEFVDRVTYGPYPHTSSPEEYGNSVYLWSYIEYIQSLTFNGVEYDFTSHGEYVGRDWTEDYWGVHITNFVIGYADDLGHIVPE